MAKVVEEAHDASCLMKKPLDPHLLNGMMKAPTHAWWRLDTWTHLFALDGPCTFEGGVKMLCGVTLGFGILVDEEKKHKTFGHAHYIDYFHLIANQIKI